MTNRNAKAIAVHDGHHAMKLRSMIGTPLQDIVLPLVNHFVRQGSDEFVVRLILEQRNRQPNQSSFRVVHPRTCQGSRSQMTHKHPNRRRQPTTPDNRDRPKLFMKVTPVYIAPDILYLIPRTCVWDQSRPSILESLDIQLHCKIWRTF